MQHAIIISSVSAALIGTFITTGGYPGIIGLPKDQLREMHSNHEQGLLGLILFVTGSPAHDRVTA